MDREIEIRDGKSVSPPSSSGLLRASTTDHTGERNPEPDPRWPSKFRWSVIPKSLPPMTTSPPTPSSTTTNLLLAVEVNTGVASTPSLPPAVVGCSPENLIQVETSKEGKNCTLQVKDNESLPSDTVASLQGAWAQPLKIISGPSLSSTSRVIAEDGAANLSSPELWPSLSVQKGQDVGQKFVAPSKSFRAAVQAMQKPVERKEDDSRFPWAARMNPASRNLYRATEPEFLDDGTPKVIIPQHVLLQGLENQKEYILGQFYRCSPPPGGLIYAVFNKLWGRKCRITIKKLGESNYLFHIPDEATRIWVLQRGLWHVDDCLMFVASWTPEATLAIPEIKTVPVWVTLKKIPHICYSIAGISHIASGLGAPMATHKPWLDPIFMGEAKILVEVELSKAFPSRIAAEDKNGFISMVDVEYAWLPTKCSRCGQLGHKVKRCLQSETAKESEDVVISATVEASHSPPLVLAITKEVIPATNIVLPAKEPLIIATASVVPVIESVESPIAQSNVLAASVIIDSTESLFPEIAPFVSASTSTIAHDNVHSESKVKHSLGSNRFASLDSSEGEDSLDSDKESDSMDFMTPSGKRILRERPTKPSVKAKEMASKVVGGGRGNQGRGSRGGRG